MKVGLYFLVNTEMKGQKSTVILHKITVHDHLLNTRKHLSEQYSKDYIKYLILHCISFSNMQRNIQNTTFQCCNDGYFIIF